MGRGGLCWFAFYENRLNGTLDGVQVHQWAGRRDGVDRGTPSDLPKVSQHSSRQQNWTQWVTKGGGQLKQEGVN